MIESLNSHLQAFQAIKQIPESEGANRQNQLASARAELTATLQAEFPDRVTVSRCFAGNRPGYQRLERHD